ncbi:MAG: helix-turn-helix transcriptional regulator [Trichormus sp. ATA11-4-KO1]|jgi:transcriptional regulator with XRE-family HTH domain|nr:helix-turn-helix transcriptional regulator [Trichormus sp. ATA11-4-KO1]
MNEQKRREELAHFLQTRRAKLKPAQVNLPNGSRRRIPGLRREEVAELAEIGVTWYTWLEQGRDIKVSLKTVERIAAALRLDEHEKKHLFLLTKQPLFLSSAPDTPMVSKSMQHILDALRITPAYITNHRWDILAWNRSACALLGDFEQMPLKERNLMWLAFTDTTIRQLFVDWEDFAQCLLAQYRSAYGYYEDEYQSRELTEALQELSSEFQEWWSCHNVISSGKCHQELAHPIVGRLVR